MHFMFLIYYCICTLYNVYIMQVEKFAVQRPLRERGEVVGGGEVVARLRWLNGPGVFMQKYVHKNPLQDYRLYQTSKSNTA